MSEELPADSIEVFRRRVLTRAPRMGCFDAQYYIAMHPDVATVDPYRHFAAFGIWEGRRGVASERLLGRLAEASIEATLDAVGPAGWEQGYRRTLGLHPTLIMPDLPNLQDLATARALTAALEHVGVTLSIVPTVSHDESRRRIILSPAQTLFQNDRGEADFRTLVTAIVVAHAAPDDASFAEELPFILGAAGVITTSAETAALLRHAGLPCAWIWTPVADEVEPAPITHPLYAGLGRRIQASPARAAWPDRPIDVLAIQPMTPARKNAWEYLTEPLQAFATLLYPAPKDADLSATERALRRYLLDRSKIVLNLHGEAGGALPAVLAEEAALAGAVLVSEPNRPHPFMRASAHYFEIGPRRMGPLVDELLHAPLGRDAAEKMIISNRALWIGETDPEIDGLALVNLFANAADLEE